MDTKITKMLLTWYHIYLGRCIPVYIRWKGGQQRKCHIKLHIIYYLTKSVKTNTQLISCNYIVHNLLYMVIQFELHVYFEIVVESEFHYYWIGFPARWECPGSTFAVGVRFNVTEVTSNNDQVPLTPQRKPINQSK